MITRIILIRIYSRGWGLFAKFVYRSPNDTSNKFLNFYSIASSKATAIFSLSPARVTQAHRQFPCCFSRTFLIYLLTVSPNSRCLQGHRRATPATIFTTTMNSTRDRVISLLGQGFSQAVVANTLGVQPSWISQLLDEPEVRQQVMHLRTNQLQERVEADKTLESMEKRALKLLDDKMAFVRSPKEAASIFVALNRAVRKTANLSPEQDAVALQQVNITLPKAAASIHIKINDNNQVIEVEGRSMATLPSRALPSLSASKQQAIEAAPVPTVFDIQQATQRRLQHDDTSRADAALETLPVIRDLEVMLDGVPCVL